MHVNALNGAIAVGKTVTHTVALLCTLPVTRVASAAGGLRAGRRRAAAAASSGGCSSAAAPLPPRRHRVLHEEPRGAAVCI